MPFFRAGFFVGGGDGCSAGEAARFFLVVGGIVAVMHGSSASNGLACFESVTKSNELIRRQEKRNGVKARH